MQTRSYRDLTVGSSLGQPIVRPAAFTSAYLQARISAIMMPPSSMTGATISRESVLQAARERIDDGHLLSNNRQAHPAGRWHRQGYRPRTLRGRLHVARNRLGKNA